MGGGNVPWGAYAFFGTKNSHSRGKALRMHNPSGFMPIPPNYVRPLPSKLRSPVTIYLLSPAYKYAFIPRTTKAVFAIIAVVPLPGAIVG